MHIICHYAEIGLKGKNRRYFENKLAGNIKKNLESEVPECLKDVKTLSGRIIASLRSEPEKENKESIIGALRKTFGVAHFSFAEESDPDIAAVEKAAWNMVKRKDFETFRVTAQRSDKTYPLTSHQINEQVGGYLVGKTGKKVRLKNADLEIFIEIVDRRAFVYAEKISGPGGMPVGTGGKAVVMLSGGIDSPVAAWYALKRGVSPVFVHFHSVPFTSRESIDKVKQLAAILRSWGARPEIHLVPFADTQKEVALKTPEKLRVILYRRLMFKIGEKIARRENCQAFVTGESIGQVASQTLENMRAIEEATPLPVLRPLAGFDKQEIIEKAKKIGTYEISILPHDDCCTRLMPRHPETKAKLEEVRLAEANLNIASLVKTSTEESLCQSGR